MKKDIKKKWLDELKSGKHKHVAHCLKCGDMLCSMGVLCELYIKEHPKQKWDVDGLYAINHSAPSYVIEWAGLSPSEQSKVITANATFDGGEEGRTRSYNVAISYIEDQL